MKNFNSTENAAIEAGVSVRHYKRVADSLNLKPVVGGSPGRPKFFWTTHQIEQIRIEFGLRGAEAKRGRQLR